MTIDFGITDENRGLIAGYEQLLLQRRLASASEARLQALLWWAVDFGTPAQVEQSISAGANPNIVFPRGYTPLGRVLSSFPPDSRHALVQSLLAAGADPATPSDREAPLIIASKSGPPDAARLVLQSLLKRGKPAPDSLNAALLYAAARGQSQLVADLISAGASVNHLGNAVNPLIQGGTASPLMLAGHANDCDSIRRLLDAGADVNLRDGEGHTAYDYAAADPKRCAAALRLILNAGGKAAVPFPSEFEESDDFIALSRAAKKAGFKNAVAKVKELTGIDPAPLVSDEPIPGGFGFVFEDPATRSFPDSGIAGIVAVIDRARAFVQKHQDDFLKKGAYLFYTRDLTEQNGPAVAILPTKDMYQVIAAVGTESPEMERDDLIDALRRLEKDHRFMITGAGPDFLEGKFTAPLHADAAAAITRRLNEICSMDDPAVSVEEQAATLARTGWFHLSW